MLGWKWKWSCNDFRLLWQFKRHLLFSAYKPISLDPKMSSKLKQSNKEQNRCVICGSTNYGLVLVSKDCRSSILRTTNEDFNLVQCQQCGLLFIAPTPSAETLSKFYPEAYHSRPSQIQTIIVKFLNLRKLRQIMLLKKSGLILDVGCGDGSFLLPFSERGWDTYGVDVSKSACNLAIKRLGRNIFNSELSDCHFPSNYFDVIILNHVVEHLSNPNETLKEISRILKNDGILVLFTPNVDSFQFKLSKEKWFHLDLPRHLCLYNPKTLANLIDKNGFKIIARTYPLLDYPFDLYQSLRRKLFNNSTSLDDMFLVPLLIVSMAAKIMPAFRGSMGFIVQKTAKT